MEAYDLAIDSEDNYLDQENIFYIHPGRLPTLRCVQNNSFNGCFIQNTPVSALSSINLVTVMEKMKQQAEIKVYVDQPITVMQDYDAKQIEANLKCAGFENIGIDSGSYVKESTGKTIETLVVTASKPVRNPNVASVTVTTTTTTTTTKRRK